MTDEDLLARAAKAKQFVRRRRKLTDFRYDEVQDKYWDTTTGTLLSQQSVNGAIHQDDWPSRPDKRNGKDIFIKPSDAINDIDSGLTVEGSTWWPGLPKFVENVVITERGAMQIKGAVCYNAYVPPDPPRASKQPATPWIKHVKKLYPAKQEHEHFFDFCAHMIQRPDEKINHGIVMAGAQGIGKDTALLPVRRGVGEWNAAEIGPDAISSPYNGYLRSVLLVINEVRPHDEDHKASNFYNLLKPMLAAPPEMLPMTLKYANTVYVRNLCHVILTTNDPLTMYIPPEDRRLFVMTSQLPDPKTSKVFTETYFDDLYEWLEDGGSDAVIAWLVNRDISTLLPAAPPLQTYGKTAIQQSAHQVRRTLVDDLLEEFCDHRDGDCTVFFHKDLLDFIDSANLFDDAAKTRGLLNAKNFHFKMFDRGYDMYRNPDGQTWKNGRFVSRTAFVHREVPQHQHIQLIQEELSKR